MENPADLALCLEGLRKRRGLSYEAMEHAAATLRSRGGRRRLETLSKSTVGEIVTGKRLPTRAKFLAFLTVCGIPEADFAQWLAAWERASTFQYRTSPDFVTHWDPVSRGISVVSAEAGWYFTGRSEILRNLVEWMTEPSPTRESGLVVTGDPGSGKSAVLGRLVTLSDAEYRRRWPKAVENAPPGTVPPVGTVDVAVHARGLTLPDVSRTLAAACGVAGDSPDHVWRAVIAGQRPLRIIVDALDEAADGGDDIARNFLRPLARHGRRIGVRVLVGARREVLAALGSPFEVLDLNENDPYDDVVGYVTRLLSETADGPYRGDPERADAMAALIATRANNNFLVAQLAAESVSEESAAPDSSVWRSRLPSSVGDAMEDYIARFGPESTRVRDLLRALAYAQADGLEPGDLWLAIANAVAKPQRYEVADLAWLVENADSYLIDVTKDDPRGAPARFRIYHQALADHLTQSGQRLRHQSAIVEALIARVPTAGGLPDWSAAEPYIRQETAGLAASCGRIRELVDQPRFLLAAEPVRLTAAFASASDGTVDVVASVYRRALTHLAATNIADAAAWLQLNAKQLGAETLSDRIMSDLPMRWHVPWAKVRAAAGHFLAEDLSNTNDARIVTIDGRPVAISVHDDGMLRIWDLRSGVLDRKMAAHDGTIVSLELGEIRGDPVIVTVGWGDKKTRIWDGCGLNLIAEYETYPSWYARCSQIRDTPVVLLPSGTDAAELRIVETDTGSFARTIAQHWAVSATDIVRADNREFFLTVAVHQACDTIRAWALHDGREIDELRGGPAHVKCARISALHGRPVVAWGAGGIIGRAGIWDVLGRSSILEVDAHPGGAVGAVDIGTLGGDPVLVTGGYNDGVVRVWSLDGQQLAIFEGHRNVGALAAGRLDHRDVVFSGGRDGDDSVRLWDLTLSSRLNEPVHKSAVSGLSVGEFESRVVVASCGEWDDGSIHVRSVADGALLHEFRGHRRVAFDVKLSTFDRQDCLVSLGSDELDDHSVRVWLPGQMNPMREFRETYTAHCMDVATVNQWPVVAVAGGADTVRLFSLHDGAELCAFRGPYKSVWSLAMVFDQDLGWLVVFGTSGDGPYSTVWVRQVASGDEITAFMAHQYSVNLAAATFAGAGLIATFGGSGYDSYDYYIPGDQSVKVWTTRGRLVRHLTHSSPLTAVTLGELAQGPVVVAGDAEGAVIVWDLESGQSAFRIRVESRVTTLCLIGDDSVLVGTALGTSLIRLHVHGPAT
ncbi:helix-turn-helix domain-containing protein [Streptomyces lavendulocolor]|uniref:helix-turn-helix domain-containing protein n=1 Tax=Streptomyces lavendulocolor TaxID=67316 RepID=UPI003C2B3B77